MRRQWTRQIELFACDTAMHARMGALSLIRSAGKKKAAALRYRVLHDTVVPHSFPHVGRRNSQNRMRRKNKIPGGSWVASLIATEPFRRREGYRRLPHDDFYFSPQFPMAVRISALVEYGDMSGRPRFIDFPTCRPRKTLFEHYIQILMPFDLFSH